MTLTRSTERSSALTEKHFDTAGAIDTKNDAGQTSLPAAAIIPEAIVRAPEDAMIETQTHAVDADRTDTEKADTVGAIDTKNDAGQTSLPAAAIIPESIVRAPEDAMIETQTHAVDADRTDTEKADTARLEIFFWLRDTMGRFPGLIAPSHTLFCSVDEAAPIGTFRRATSATHLGQGGTLEKVQPGRLRQDWAANGTLLGWLIEPQSINRVLWSEQLQEKIWLKSGATVVAKNERAPDSTMSADKLVEDTSAKNFHRLIQLVRAPLTTPISVSFFVRSEERSRLRVYVFNANAIEHYLSADIDLKALTVQIGQGGDGAATTGFLTACGQGWHRVVLSGIVGGEAKAEMANIQVRLCNERGADVYPGDGKSGLYVWGAQVEAGALSSYIPTYSGPIARGAEVWTLPLAASWFNPTEGTLFLSGRAAAGLPLAGTVQVLAQYDDGTADNGLQVSRHHDGTLCCSVIAAGAETASLALGSVANCASFRVAFAWSATGFAAAQDGDPCVQAPSAPLPESLTSSRIGADVFGLQQWGGHVLHAAAFPVALSNTQLQTLTAKGSWHWPV